jgi:hypothetical protein
MAKNKRERDKMTAHLFTRFKSYLIDQTRQQQQQKTIFKHIVLHPNQQRYQKDNKPD